MAEDITLYTSFIHYDCVLIRKPTLLCSKTCIDGSETISSDSEAIHQDSREPL